MKQSAGLHVRVGAAPRNRTWEAETIIERTGMLGPPISFDWESRGQGFCRVLQTAGRTSATSWFVVGFDDTSSRINAES
jgi:hypothetical protein